MATTNSESIDLKTLAPLTSLTGNEIIPALSADGSAIGSLTPKLLQQLANKALTEQNAPGQTIFVKLTDASGNEYKVSLANLLNSLRIFQDGVWVGKVQKETWGTYMRIEPWQTTNIGITAADADAIVIQHGGYRLGLALDEPDALPWGNGNTLVAPSPGLDTYEGKSMTAAIMANATYSGDDATKYAVAYAYNYSKGHTGDPGGTSTIGAHSWWLPTMGDLALIHQHFEAINAALTRIKNAGKQSVSLLQRTDYWSCCEYSATNAWHLNFVLGTRGTNAKTTGRYRVRPVTAF